VGGYSEPDAVVAGARAILGGPAVRIPIRSRIPIVSCAGIEAMTPIRAADVQNTL